MAKQCASNYSPPQVNLPPSVLALPPLPRPWEDRVFKNTYVRHGQRKEVKAWAVRIQFHGIRKTFSLKAADRAVAAVEAREIHDLILSQGWEVALQWHRVRRMPQLAVNVTGDDLAREDVAYWKPRLIRRKYTEPLHPPSTRALSVRIGDETIQYWFPLGTDAEEPAAAKALEIYRTLRAEGWQSVCRKFPREVTVAIFWAVSPVAVTYTTFYTLVGDDPEISVPMRNAREPRRNVAVIEPDVGIRRALAFWLDRQPGLRCVMAAGELDAVFDLAGANRPDLLLVNREMPGPSTEDLTQRLKTKLPGLPVFAYAISEHIDQIFISLSGVKAGYIFHRRVPSELLEPVQGALRETFSADEVAQQIRAYFGGLFGAGLSVGGNPRIGNLTSRELEVLNLLTRGCVDKEIGDILRISVWTVHSHLKKIYEKLQVHTRTEAVLKFLEK